MIKRKIWLICLFVFFVLIKCGVCNASSELINNWEFNTDDINIVKVISGGEIERVDSNEKGFLQLTADEDIKAASYFDIKLSDMEKYSSYVIDMNIKINSLSGSSSFNILDSKNTVGTWRLGYSIKNTGEIMSRSGFGKVSEIMIGEYNRVSVVYDNDSDIAYIYVNGILIYNHDIPDDYYPSIFRFDAISEIGGVLNVEIDWIRLYSGTTLLEEEELLWGNLLTVMDHPALLAEALDDKYVFMPGNNTMYLNGSKTTIGDNESRIMNISGTLMIPLDILNSIDNDAWIYDSSVSEITFGEYKFRLNDKKYIKSGVEDELSSPVVTQNETVYFPLRSIFEKVYGKKVDWDNRGFAVVSDSGIEVREDYYYLDHHKTWSPADLIYRFMQFDNPSGADIIADVSEKHPNKAHPRVWWTTDAMKYILNKSDNDGEWKGAYNEAIASANGHLKRDFSSLYTASEQEKQNAVSRDFQPVMESLATAYLLSGDEQYAEKAVEMMKGFCSWDSLGFKVSNLTTGHWAAAMGIGYDTFYNYMNRTTQGQADLKYIRESIKRLTFDEHIEMYKKEAGQHWIDINDNFAGVVGGGYMMLLLAVCDEEDLREECEYLLPNVLKTLYSAAELYYPNGGYFEGVPYSTYMLGNFVKGLDAMFECCGTDYGLGSVPGFTRAGDYFTYLQTSKGCFNFHDALPLYSNNPVREFIGYRYNDPVQAEMGRRHKLLAHAKYDLRSLYYYSKAVVDKGLENIDLSGVDLDRYFYGSESGAFRSTFEETNPTFVGFHGGRTNIAHDMLDTGEFVFEADGVVWAIDLGGDDYSLPSYFLRDGYRIYRKRTEGENCLVINPSELTDSDGTEYYGQALGEAAEIIAFESASSGAMSVYDLTELYKRDVNSYKRGYYFGDNRHSLIIQDEVSLKESSELYWFMHTMADIQIIDNNTAILTQDGKKLRAELYCDAVSYKLLAMEAKPLPGSPVIEGQNENEGVTKLAVHIEDARENVTISVKLSPLNNYYNPTELKSIPISEWEIPSEDIQVDSVIENIIIDPFGILTADVQLPYNCSDIALYIDGYKIADLDNAPAGYVHPIVPIRTGIIDSGLHTIKLVTVSNDGTVQSDTEVAHIPNYQKKTHLSQLPLPDKVSVISGNVKFGVTTSGYHTVSNSVEDGYRIVKQENVDDIPDCYARIYAKPVNKWINGVISLETTLRFSNSDASLNLCLIDNESYKLNKKIIDLGNIINYGITKVNEELNIKVLVDIDNDLYSIIINDVIVVGKTLLPDLSSVENMFFELTDSTPVGTVLTISDFKVTHYFDKSEEVTLRILRESDDTLVCVSLSDESMTDEYAFNLFICQYCDNELIDVSISHVSLTNDNADYLENVDISEKCDKVKIIGVSDIDSLTPLCSSYAYFR